MYFRVFGAVYALVAVLGIYVGNGLLLGIISNNTPDVGLHVVIAIVSRSVSGPKKRAPQPQ